MALTAEDSPLAGAVDLALTTAVGDGNEVLGPTLLRYSSLVQRFLETARFAGLKSGALRIG